MNLQPPRTRIQRKNTENILNAGLEVFSRHGFRGATLDQIAAEVAAGEGETLDALAALYNVEQADREAFAQMAQANYTRIFDGNDITVADVLAGLEAAMAENQSLSRYV